ncbi:MAG: Rieske (2Fe-2S) protein [Sporichthyaceae bacterium]
MDQNSPAGDASFPDRAADGPGGDGVGGTSRRHVLGLVVVAGAGLPVLAACGGGSDTTATSGTSGKPPAASGSSAAPAGPLVATGDVPVDGGVILDARKIVVTQPTKGTFKAFSAVCTHQSCTVSTVEKGAVICPCHQSAFSITDGAPTTNPVTGKRGPAPSPLAEIAVTVQGGQVVEA